MISFGHIEHYCNSGLILIQSLANSDLIFIKTLVNSEVRIDKCEKVWTDQGQTSLRSELTIAEVRIRSEMI